MDVLFFLKKLITELVLPPFNLLLIGIFGLLIAKRWPRVSRLLVWSSILSVLIFATPAVSRLLMHALIVVPTFDASAGKSAQAIVVLGGGLRRNTPEYGDTPTQFTLDRIRYGATLARQTNLPILVTGGAVTSDTAEAESMAKTLASEFGVPPKWIEARALDTADNMNYSAAMLKPEGVTTVILVTHDFHMRRALAYCDKVGLKCVPAPVSFQGHGAHGVWVYELPDAYGLWISSLALHEILGNLALNFQ